MARARLSLELSAYNPISHVSGIKAPVMLISAKKDTVCPPELVQRAAEAMGDLATVKEYDVSHFGIYRGKVIEEVLVAELDFLRKHLRAK